MGFAVSITQIHFPAKLENGKPHQEQSQIAYIALAVPVARRLNAGRLLKKTGNGFVRQMAVSDRQEYHCS